VAAPNLFDSREKDIDSRFLSDIVADVSPESSSPIASMEQTQHVLGDRIETDAILKVLLYKWNHVLDHLLPEIMSHATKLSGAAGLYIMAFHALCHT
jgi:hypothetical protein